MSIPSTVRFAWAARALTAEARRLGLAPPGFRSPPRLSGCDRTIRRRPTGTVVAVRLRQRPFADVVADMVDGVVAANGLEGEAAARTRVALVRVVSDGDREERSAA